MVDEKQPWEMRKSEYFPPTESYGPPKAFSIPADSRDPIMKEIKFVPVRGKSGKSEFTGNQIFVKAVRVDKNGRESRASASDISSAAGKLFFDTDTSKIGYPRLQRWLKGQLTEDEAAVWTGHEGEITQREFEHRESVKKAIEEGKITSHPDYPELSKSLGKSPVSEYSEKPTTPEVPPSSRPKVEQRKGAFSNLLKGLPRPDVQNLLAENGLELTDDDGIIFRDQRGGGQKIKMTKAEFVDWLLGNNPKDDPATYAPNDPAWKELIGKARALVAKEQVSEIPPSVTHGGSPFASCVAGPP